MPEHKSGWNYRIMKTMDGGEPFYRIVECFYGPSGYSEAGSPCGNDIDEIKRVFARMQDAMTKPVIDENCREIEPPLVA